MQSLMLENYGTVEMNQNEMSNTDGGGFSWDQVLMAIDAMLSDPSYTNMNVTYTNPSGASDGWIGTGTWNFQ